eukprot:CAMPEP_0172882748 /NCGR_PEP_ID=MMETSP1075-20121228/120931_1 /TAXON_ID=2916 /ORGANISM="Ceratium fusus, Strain PA161109" /LENGTH=56 /DNA_ID=CAMNT_0013735491 /DNA_START=188 /DNA_END=358 /DNA_ORIENTATION=+
MAAHGDTAQTASQGVTASSSERLAGLRHWQFALPNSETTQQGCAHVHDTHNALSVS